MQALLLLQLQQRPREPPSVHWDIGIDPEGAEAASGGSGDQFAPCRCAEHSRTLPERLCITASLDQEQRHDAQNGPQSRNPPEDGQTPSQTVEGLLATFDGLQAHIWSAAALGIPVPLYHHSFEACPESSPT